MFFLMYPVEFVLKIVFILLNLSLKRKKMKGAVDVHLLDKNPSFWFSPVGFHVTVAPPRD